MNNHCELINKFYSSFQKKNFKDMIDCYHSEIHFKDEVFNLKGKKACAMWHMLCERGRDLEITFGNVEINDNFGKVHWEAKYTFAQIKRKVHNKIQAKFEFRDGKIIQHTDIFNFWRCSSQALGLPGIVLGWSSFLKKKVSLTANTSLNKFIETHPDYS
jgi:hypothetical protein